MNEYDLRRLALISAELTDVEAMKLENAARIANNDAPAYNSEHFFRISERLRIIAYKHNDQL